MRTKIVYVLVSRETDYYYEMLLLSLYSLRLHHPKGDAVVEVVMDEDTHQRLVDKKAEILNDVTPIVVPIPSEYTVMQRSRYLKTQLRYLVRGNFLYLDTDTLVCEKLNDIDKVDASVAMVANENDNLQLENVEVIEKCQKLGFDIQGGENYFNSGVIYAMDDVFAQQLFSSWHAFWQKSCQMGVPQDQFSLCAANKTVSNIISGLPDIWNFQLFCNSTTSNLKKCKIFHYFSSQKSFLRETLFSKIKEHGMVPAEVRNVARSPRTVGYSAFSASNDRILNYIFSDMLYTYEVTPPFQDTNVSGSPSDRPCPSIVERETSVPESNQQELISVIVPVYNIEAYLPKCLDTISRQTYRNLEIILVDDGSTDGSGKICDEFAAKDSRAVVIHQENSGRGPARNSGKKIAHGNYLLFPDGDDYMHLDAINIMYQHINQSDELDLVMVNYAHSGDPQKEFIHPIQSNLLTQEQMMYRFFHNLPIAMWGKLFRKELIEDIWVNNYERCQDSDFVVRTLLRARKGLWINEQLYFYVQRQGSATHQNDSKLKENACVLQISYNNLNSLSLSQKRYQHYFLKQLYATMAFLRSNVTTVDLIEQCKRYEKKTRKIYWTNKDIKTIEKIALTTTVHFPRLIKLFKRMTNGRLSWHILSKF